MAESKYCTFCKQEIPNEDDIFKFRNSNGFDYWHKECAINQGYDLNKQVGGYLTNQVPQPQYKLFGVTLIVFLIFVLLIIFAPHSSNNTNTRTKLWFEKNPKEWTNKDLKDYEKHMKEKAQKERENEKAFK